VWVARRDICGWHNHPCAPYRKTVRPRRGIPAAHGDLDSRLICSRYLVDKDIVDVGAGELELASLCIGYLSFPGFESDRNDAELAIFVRLGYYGFFDYAYAYWSHHLDACVRLKRSRDELEEIREAAEVFTDLHWIEPQTKVVIRKSFIDRWKPLENGNNFDKLLLAGYLGQRQLIASTNINIHEQVLSLYETVSKIRRSLEEEWRKMIEPGRLRTMYGTSIYKCPRPNCVHFYNGFATEALRNAHVPKHERSFFCSFPGCAMGTLGCATLRELQKHETEYHGTIDFDDDEPDFPETPAEKSSFQCNQCDAKFTRNNNLKIHMRKHTAPNQKAFICSQCGKSFARLGDRTRHESTTHANAKTFTCGGTLENGFAWGCNREFSRGDMLSRHWKSGKGKTCISPKEQEEALEAASMSVFSSSAPTPSSGT
jgi:hypothetical protein